MISFKFLKELLSTTLGEQKDDEKWSVKNVAISPLLLELLLPKFVSIGRLLLFFSSLTNV